MTKRAWKALGIVLAVLLIGSIAVAAQPGNPEPELWQEEGAVRMKFAYDPTDGTEFYVNHNWHEDWGRTLRVYGHDDKSANFPYDNFDGPFDLKSPEAPPKDFVVHNPAIFDHDDFGTYPLNRYISADGDAWQKTHLRTWYTPCYTEPLGMTSPVVPDYKLDCYPAVVNEYTYIMLDDTTLNPTHGSAGNTRMVFPMSYRDDDTFVSTQVGLEGYDINNDDVQEIMLVENIVPVAEDTTHGEIWVRPESPLPGGNLNLEPGGVMQFFDYEFELHSWNVVEGWARFFVRYVGRGCDTQVNVGTVQLQVPGVCQTPGCYLGDTALVPARTGDPNIIRGDYPDVAAQVQAVTHPFWFQLKSLNVEGGPGTELESVTVVPRRVLKAGETFFVDGAAYDVAAIFVLADPDGQGPEFKYITIRQPLNKDEDTSLSLGYTGCPPEAIFIPALSVDKSTFPAGWELPVLPPFNMLHDRVDDINIPKDPTCVLQPDQQLLDNPAECIESGYRYIEDRMVKYEDPLVFSWITETKEDRFDTNLFEEKFTEPEQQWQWINIETMPWHYTSLDLPEVGEAPGLAERGYWGDYILVSSFITEDSTELWPGEGSVRVKFVYDAGSYDQGPMSHIHGADLYVNDAGYNNQFYNIDANSLRVYGRGTKNAAFPYQTFSGPFDLTSPEAPAKDFVVFNPAFIDHLNYGGALGEQIKVSGFDANEKVHLRMWYTPDYLEPAGETYPVVTNPQSNWDLYDKGTIVMEYTYILLQDATNNIMPGTAGNTQFVFPMAYESEENSSSVNLQPGLEGYDVNRDGTNELMRLEKIVAPEQGDSTLGEIWVAPRPTEGGGMDLAVGDTVQFLDYEVELVSFDFQGDAATFEVWYVGSDFPVNPYSLGTVRLSIFGNDAALYNRLGRLQTGTRAQIEGQVEAVTAPFWITLESVWNDGVEVVPHRVLKAGESFFVDGLEYDVAAIYIVETDAGQALKYITIRNPLDKCGGDIWLDKMSVNKVCVEHYDSTMEQHLPVLPPFNDPLGGRLDLVDDTDLQHEVETGPDTQYDDNWGTGCWLIENRITTYDQPLDIGWLFIETKETRFDTNLLEEKFTEPEQEWMWINIETLPWHFTEFVLPDLPNVDCDTTNPGPDSIGDYILVSSWLTEDSDIVCTEPTVVLQADKQTVEVGRPEMMDDDLVRVDATVFGRKPISLDWGFEPFAELVEGGEEYGVFKFVQTGTFDLSLTATNECGEATESVTIETICFGDFNDSGDRTAADIMLMLSAWNKSVGEEGYEARFDVTNSGHVGLADIMMVVAVWNTSCP